MMMVRPRVLVICGAAALCCYAGPAFLMPGAVPTTSTATARASVEQMHSTSSKTTSNGWGTTCIAAVAIGAQAGLSLALYGRRTTVYNKDVTNAAEDRLFEQVYNDYTKEYLKGPMYSHPDKLQGVLPDYPGEPLFKNGKATSESLQNLKNYGSNMLAFFSVLFFGMGLYGCLMFNVYDPQWAKVDAGENMNATYIVLSLFLPISFWFHVGSYIQKKNGK